MQTGTMRLRELTIRYTVKRLGDGTPALTIQMARAPRDCAASLMRLLEDEPSEIFAILCLNTKLRVLAYHEVSRGSLDTTVVHPREVFRAAILANAAAIILVHNHPSGDPTPSADDVVLTQRLRAAGTLLGIEVLDHLVIGDGQYCSFTETGRWS
jgi:DNA repair protein RadC